MTFPLSPNKGDTYTYDNTVFTYNGAAWDRTIIGPNNSTNYASLGSQSLLDRIAHLEALTQNSLILE